MTDEPAGTVLPGEDGLRLDKVLRRIMPGTGLRGIRRACGLGLVLVNGRPASGSFKVRTGDAVTLAPEEKPTAEADAGGTGTDGPALLFPSVRPALVLRVQHLAFLSKPAGLHTEPLAGKPGASLKDALPELLGGECPDARLLNRLDLPTSGIVTAALDRTGADFYRAAQDEGKTEKCYLALLEGRLAEDRLVRNRLLLSGRDKVLAELEPHNDRRRHTCLSPLAFFRTEGLPPEILRHAGCGTPPEWTTLAGCTILKGARHQIRVHAASIGHPLLGDGRYGAALRPEEGGEERFFLHHAMLTLPGVRALCLPEWLHLLGREAETAAEHWMHAKDN